MGNRIQFYERLDPAKNGIYYTPLLGVHMTGKGKREREHFDPDCSQSHHMICPPGLRLYLLHTSAHGFPFSLSVSPIHKCDAMRFLVVLFWHDIRNIIPWVPVQALLQSFLIHVVTNETNTTAKNKKAVY